MRRRDHRGGPGGDGYQRRHDDGQPAALQTVRDRPCGGGAEKRRAEEDERVEADGGGGIRFGHTDVVGEDVQLEAVDHEVAEDEQQPAPQYEVEVARVAGESEGCRDLAEPDALARRAGVRVVGGDQHGRHGEEHEQRPRDLEPEGEVVDEDRADDRAHRGPEQEADADQRRYTRASVVRNTVGKDGGDGCTGRVQCRDHQAPPERQPAEAVGQ
nr:hypothetical protein [Microbacterium sp. cf046]